MPATTRQEWATITFEPAANGLGHALTSFCHLDVAVRLELCDGRVSMTGGASADGHGD